MNEWQCQLILELARREGRRVRFAGVGHSPSDLACTKEYMLRTTKLNRVLEVGTRCVLSVGVFITDRGRVERCIDDEFADCSIYF